MPRRGSVGARRRHQEALVLPLRGRVGGEGSRMEDEQVRQDVVRRLAEGIDQRDIILALGVALAVVAGCSGSPAGQDQPPGPALQASRPPGTAENAARSPTPDPYAQARDDLVRTGIV